MAQGHGKLQVPGVFRDYQQHCVLDLQQAEPRGYSLVKYFKSLNLGSARSVAGDTSKVSPVRVLPGTCLILSHGSFLPPSQTPWALATSSRLFPQALQCVEEPSRGLQHRPQHHSAHSVTLGAQKPPASHSQPSTSLPTLLHLTGCSSHQPQSPHSKNHSQRP